MMKADLGNDIDSKTIKLGTTLIDLLLKSGVNLFMLVKRRREATMLHFTEEAYKLINDSRALELLYSRKYPILIAPPKDWEGFYGSGGYYTDTVNLPLVKSRGYNKKLLSQYFKKKPPTKFINVVNKIQQTGWRINRRVYDVIDRVMEDNLVDLNCPNSYPYLIGNIPYNDKLEVTDFVRPEQYGEVIEEGRLKGLPADREKYREWYKAKEIQQGKINQIFSKALAFRLAMNDAKYYYDYDNIYFSYQVDFRGRLYPIQQHLNPQSSGNIKALLEFSNGVSIENKEQLKWFKIYGANCLGYDKLSYEERVNEVDKREEEIHLIASNPIGAASLWKDADEPYLYLAWCFEYSDYLNNPDTFRSYISISLDATCSGIQIYSGLLRDRDGAEAVNVIGNGTEYPSDIYKEVANRVNKYLELGEYPKEISFKKSDGTDNVCSTLTEALSLKGKVNRKLTKRNTMTQPYSVTKYGMYEQLKDQLDEMELEGNKIWEGDKWVVAKLLTELNDRAIVETVQGARVGQEFLKKVADIVSKNNDYVFYTTPIMEFPVLQKIPKQKIDRVRTQLGRLNLRIDLPEIHTQKMVNGIAPNVVHSLDATLMYLTIDKLDTNYHLIHDSFGVSINAIPELNRAVRESFIELFSGAPLKYIISQVYKEVLSEVDEIMINTLDLDEVRDSKYIFS